MKVALVYDRVNKWGGAERVLLALQELFPNAPLYTSVYSKTNARWANKFKVQTSFLQKVRFAQTSHEYFALAMPVAFEQFTFDDYDLVISVTSEAAKGILTKPGTRHICYCLTPTRYLWSGYDEYFSNNTLRFLSRPAVDYLKKWDLAASKRPDKMIAISKEVKKRIKRYYDREAEVIYPPLSIFGISKGDSKDFMKGSYFLVVSRLVFYKRVDIAVKACTRLNLPLVVVGTGSQEDYLREIAGPSIKFVGALTDSDLVRYYKNCIALIFPGVEDFGLTVVEAQSYGKPVIAYKGGGAEETIIDGKTGLFFYPQTIKALMNTLNRFSHIKFNPENSIKNANLFQKKIFQDKFLSSINNL